MLQTIQLLFNQSNNNLFEKNRDVTARLKFLANVKIGDKIDSRNLQVEKPGIWTSIKRKVWSDGRDNTFLFLNNTIDRSFEILHTHVKSEKSSDRVLCINIISDLVGSIQGLKNLQKTYKDDNMFVCNIESLIETIQIRLVDLKEINNNIISEDDIKNMKSNNKN